MKTHKNLKRTVLGSLFCAALLMPMSGCEKKGPLEEAGEKIDDAVDDISDEVKEVIE